MTAAEKLTETQTQEAMIKRVDEQEEPQAVSDEDSSVKLTEEELVQVIEENLSEMKRAHPYGYVAGGNVFGATKEDLKKNLFKFGISRFNYIWTPESERLLKPEQTDFVFEIYKESAIKSAKKSILVSLIFLVLPLALAVVLEDWSLVFSSLIFIIGVALFTNGIWNYQRARKLSKEELAENIAEERKAISYFEEASKTKTSYQTYIILVCIAAVFLAEMYVGQNNDGEFKAVYIAGQIKELVRQGEYWRLLTATVMHANFIHIFLNGMALWNIGRAIEEQLDSSYLAIVFFLSAICGSLLSQAFYFHPKAPSIGASGGIMGLIGFLAASAYIYKEIFPREYFRALIQNIALIALIGVVGYSVIDNAAHAGGLFCGVGLGFLLLKKKGTYPAKPSGAIEVLSLACLAFVVAISLVCIWILYKTIS